VIERVPPESARIASVDMRHYSVGLGLRTGRLAAQDRKTKDRAGGLPIERLLMLPKSPVEGREVEWNVLRWRCASKSIAIDPEGHIEVYEEEAQYDHNQAKKNGQRIPGGSGIASLTLRQLRRQDKLPTAVR